MPSLKVNSAFSVTHFEKALASSTVAGGECRRAHALEALESRFHLGALAGLRRQLVLEHAILAARAANHLAQLKILRHGQFRKRADDCCRGGCQLFGQNLNLLCLARPCQCHLNRSCPALLSGLSGLPHPGPSISSLLSNRISPGDRYAKPQKRRGESQIRRNPAICRPHPPRRRQSVRLGPSSSSA